ncbi:MAG: 4Fe-4S binding protein [Nanoarchaeota archaeon]|nr:4Fe-4S binding protein [Nanoarchaeota archaeon]
MAEKIKLTIGAVIDQPGSSTATKTGSWRSVRPVWDQKKCTQCMICWQFCPDISIPEKDKKRLETDFDYCKGCGICAQVCPFAAITMVKEEK